MKKYTSLFETENVQINTKQFKKWFGKSKAVDKTGKPLIVYHGSPNNFSSFNSEHIGKSTDTGMWGEGFYFTPDEVYASRYAKKGKVLKLYLSIKNPFLIKSKSDIPSINVPDETMEDLMNGDKIYSMMFTKYIKQKGHDGIIVSINNNNEYITFYPNQIKSATSNNGNFSIKKDSIFE